MPTFNMLYKSEIEINDDILIVIPTVGYVVDHEDEYMYLQSHPYQSKSSDRNRTL